MITGSVVFGPRTTEAERKAWAEISRQLTQTTDGLSNQGRLCNCIGPQAGESKCPCALQAESEQGQRMIRDGVVINGRKYRLVPETAPAA